MLLLFTLLLHSSNTLQPLGKQSTQRHIAQVNGWLEPAHFFNHYVVPGVPVLFKGAAKQFPAYEKWTDEFFLNHPLAKTSLISLEKGKKETRHGGMEPVPLAEFVKRYTTEDLYCVTGLPKFLREDVPIYHSINCPFILNELLDDLVMWFSSGGTRSVWHYDDYENINCLIAGRKELIMGNRSDMARLHMDVKDGSYSTVDVEAVDESKYPDFKEVVFYNASMEQGDCIYIPTFWAHTVQSWDRNIALNAWWDLYKTAITCPAVTPHMTWGSDLFFRSDSSLDEEREEREMTVADALKKLCYMHPHFLTGERISEQDFFEIMRREMEGVALGPDPTRDYFTWSDTLLRVYDYYATADKEDSWRRIFREVDANSDNILEAVEIDNMALSKLLLHLTEESKDEL